MLLQGNATFFKAILRAAFLVPVTTATVISAEHLGSRVLSVQANSRPRSCFVLPAPMDVPTSVNRKRGRLPSFSEDSMVQFHMRIMTAEVVTRTLRRESCVGAAKNSILQACFALKFQRQ